MAVESAYEAELRSTGEKAAGTTRGRRLLVGEGGRPDWRHAVANGRMSVGKGWPARWARCGQQSMSGRVGGRSGGWCLPVDGWAGGVGRRATSWPAVGGLVCEHGPKH